MVTRLATPARKEPLGGVMALASTPGFTVNDALVPDVSTLPLVRAAVMLTPDSAFV